MCSRPGVPRTGGTARIRTDCSSTWQNDRAKHYRRINNISDELGTAVNVQAMVYGNLGETSGTGVGFTRDPEIGRAHV